MQPKELYLILQYDTDSEKYKLLDYLANESNLRYEFIDDSDGELTIIIKPHYLINVRATKEYIVELHKIFVKFTHLLPRLEPVRRE